MKLYYSIKLLLLIALVQPTIAAETTNQELVAILSAKQLVTVVLSANPRLEIAQATWRAAIANITPQSALADPQFQYSFAPMTIDAQARQTDFGQRFQISQQLPLPHKLKLRAQIATYQAETKQHHIASLQLLLATSAKLLFADWYFIHQALNIHQQNHSLLQAFQQITQTHYGIGKASKQDVLRAELAITQLNHQTIRLNRQQKTILTQLNTLLNRAINTPFSIPQQLDTIKELPNFDLLHRQAMQSHPDLITISTDIKVKHTQSDLVALDYYPDLKLSLGYNSLWNDTDKRFNMGIAINIPLNQPKLRAVEQQAKANSQQAHWQKIDLKAHITEKLSIAYARVEESLHLLQLYQQQLLPLASEDLTAAEIDYQSGQGTYLTVLNSKKSQLQTQLHTAQSISNLYQHFAELEQATGSLDLLK